MSRIAASSHRVELDRTRLLFGALALVASLVAAPIAPAHAEGPAIQPGAAIETDGSGCTLAWLFQRADQQPDGTTSVSVFGSTAAHCVDSVGQQVNLAETSTRLGEVAFLGNADEEGRDYAFIAIDQAVYDQIDPAMAGHPTIPTGLSTAAAEGDVMQFSGHGTGFDLTAETRERRQGILDWDGEREHAILGVVTFGDSGGPVADVDEGGTAYGIVNTVGAGVRSDAMTIVTAGEGGANLDFVLADAAESGFSPGTLCVAGQPCGTATQ